MPLISDPFVSRSSCSALLYSATSAAGITLISPESPSKHVARTSDDVGAATSHRLPGCSQAHQPTCSAAVRVLCVGIMLRPARYSRDGLSTVRHRIGLGSIGSTLTIMRWPCLNPCAPGGPIFAALRGRLKGLNRAHLHITRYFGPKSWPFSVARPSVSVALSPRLTTNSWTSCASTRSTEQNST